MSELEKAENSASHLRNCLDDGGEAEEAVPAAEETGTEDAIQESLLCFACCKQAVG